MLVIECRVLPLSRPQTQFDLLLHVLGQELDIIAESNLDGFPEGKFNLLNSLVEFPQVGRQGKSFLNRYILNRAFDGFLPLNDKRLEVSRSERIAQEDVERSWRDEVGLQRGTHGRFAISLDHLGKVRIRELIPDCCPVRSPGKGRAVEDGMDPVASELLCAPGGRHDMVIVEVVVLRDRSGNPVAGAGQNQQIEDTVVNRRTAISLSRDRVDGMPT